MKNLSPFFMPIFLVKKILYKDCTRIGEIKPKKICFFMLNLAGFIHS